MNCMECGNALKTAVHACTNDNCGEWYFNGSGAKVLDEIMKDARAELATLRMSQQETAKLNGELLAQNAKLHSDLAVKQGECNRLFNKGYGALNEISALEVQATGLETALRSCLRLLKSVQVRVIPCENEIGQAIYAAEEELANLEEDSDVDSPIGMEEG